MYDFLLEDFQKAAKLAVISLPQDLHKDSVLDILADALYIYHQLILSGIIA